MYQKKNGITFSSIDCYKEDVESYINENTKAVYIETPTNPFSEVIEDNGRKVASNTLVLGEDNRYHMDFDDFEKKIKEEKIKLFFLSA